MIMKSSFFIVADRGSLKAFRAEKVTPERPLRLQLVQSLDFKDGYTQVGQSLEDQAGGFPVGAGPQSGQGGGNGRHQNSASEKHYEIEYDRRAARQLADRISDLLRTEHPSAWSFAAPGELKNAILDQLGAEEKSTLAESLSRDLVRTNVSELLSHFSQVRAA